MSLPIFLPRRPHREFAWQADMCIDGRSSFLAMMESRAAGAVEACAGSGKTWLLVSRMVRLMLAEAAPSELLAITFTRKAAAEMQSRLEEWLSYLALAPEERVLEFLAHRGLSEYQARESLPLARALLERVLGDRPGPMITTFHGWFFHLLSRATLASRLPPEVLEDAALLREEAWQTWAEHEGHRVRAGDVPPFAELAELVSVDGVRRMLDGFVDRCAEWWACHQEGSPDGLNESRDLPSLLGVTEDLDVLAGLFEDEAFLGACGEYARWVAQNGQRGLKSDQQRARILDDALALLRDEAAVPDPSGDAAGMPSGRSEAFARLRSVLLTRSDSVRVPNTGKEQEKRLGGEGAARYEALHFAVAERIQSCVHQLAEQRALRLDRLGLLAGQAYAETYRRLKAQRGCIDFADAELETARLLKADETSAALLMKLDARWKHVLLDEFQDTNPLQWRILKSWFAAYGADGSRPDVFLVGDPKQSIYRFRRAEPRLFDVAADWLEREYGARRFAQNETRRCAPRVVAWVNAVFEQRPDYPHFEGHTALRSELRGWCEIVSAPPDSEEAVVPGEPRNPLRAPSPALTHKRADEAARVAAHIQEAVGRLRVDEDGGRPLRFADILVLYAKRTDLEVFEDAFQHAGIPHVSDRRGGLMDTLEVGDITALLAVLVSPNDDLGLARCLKSPLFGFTDEHLRTLALRDGSWWSGLMEWGKASDAPVMVRSAAALLARWKTRIGVLPVHDLLDRIFHEGEVVMRYGQAVPERLRATVIANLNGFLTLSLAISGGRYPSLPRFLDELRQLRDKAGTEGPDEPPAAHGDVVRMMTIHGAKGLEAPVVFLIKADQGMGRDPSFGVLVDWPPESDRPTHFSLYGSAEWRGPGRDALFAKEKAQAEREHLNLLYVAMTRARQALFISGVDDGKPDSWLAQARDALVRAEMAGLPEMVWEASVPPASQVVAAADDSVEPLLAAPPVGMRIDPGGAEADFGVQVHAWLEGATEGLDDGSLRAGLGLDAATAETVRTMARRILAVPELAAAFDPARHLTAKNEMEFLDPEGRIARMDRVVEFVDEVWVLDYKTGGLGEPELARRAGPHLEQMAGYRRAAAALYPGKPVRTALVFGDGRVHWVE